MQELTLAQQINEYQPTEATAALVSSTKVALLVGISGAGKDTIKRELLKRPGFRDIISHTTRPPRVNNGILEINGIDYHFSDDARVSKLLANRAFVEAKLVHGIVYGTSASELQAAHDAGQTAITDIDVQGVSEYKRLSSGVVAIFILPPSYKVWRERLAQRYETSEAFLAEWDKRRTSAISELQHALEVPYYHFVISDDLSRAVDAADLIAHRPDTFHRMDDEARLKARDLLVAIEANS